MSQFSAVFPYFLAAHHSGEIPMPTFEELGLTSVTDAAAACFRLRERLLMSLDPLPGYGAGGDQMRELAGLFGSIGESLAICCAAEVEVELHRRARSSGTLPPEMLIGQRFFSESQAQMVLGVGHRLGNLVVRALGHYSNVTFDFTDRRITPTLSPFSDDRRAWLTVIECAAAVRRAEPLSDHPAIRGLGTALVDLVSTSAWSELEETRGEEFHRMRRESSALAGVDRDSGYSRPILDHNGRRVGGAVGSEFIAYTAADGYEERVAAVALAALLRCGVAAAEVVEAFLAALEPLTRGEYRWNGSAITQTFFMASGWDPATCRCCVGREQSGDD